MLRLKTTSLIYSRLFKFTDRHLHAIFVDNLLTRTSTLQLKVEFATFASVIDAYIPTGINLERMAKMQSQLANLQWKTYVGKIDFS